LIIMPAKKKGPSMRENQQRKLTMQKIAKGGPQLSGVKKPAPATPSAGRRINPKAAKPKLLSLLLSLLPLVGVVGTFSGVLAIRKLLSQKLTDKRLQSLHLELAVLL
jgi:hypothetical protein